MEVAGAQRVLLSLARWFHDHGYQVQAVFFYDKQDLAKKWQAQFDFPVISLNAWKAKGFAVSNLLLGLVRLFRLLRGKVTALITFTPHSNLLGLPLAWLALVPVRVGTHHGYIEGSSTRLAWLHGLLTNSWLCSAMVAVSEQVRAYAVTREGAGQSKLVVIENGIDPLQVNKLSQTDRNALRTEMGVPSGTVLLLTVGRLTVQKGHAVLLDAIVQLKEKGLQPVFAFAGDGPLRVELEEKAQQLRISSQIRFLGVRDDINELLLSADIFVQPSLWEGLSLALLEALLAGIPVVATQVEGVVDVVEDGHSALLVPPRDAGLLAAAIELLVNDETLRRHLGFAGLQRAQARYSMERMGNAYEDLLHKFVKE
jgi:glycosyltransferase involved in cell wall biosynthesis